MDFKFKKLLVPESNNRKDVEVLQLWEVRWYSRYGSFSRDIQPEVEVFSSKGLAAEFKTVLEEAFNLIRTTNGNNVTIEKAK